MDRFDFHTCKQYASDMKAVHIRDVDALVIRRIGKLAQIHKRSMQAELRVILEEASRKAEAAEFDAGDSLVLVSVPGSGSYGRQEIYGNDAR
jgi:plasmid stability protein